MILLYFQVLNNSNSSNIDEARLQGGGFGLETNLSSDEDMLDVNHHSTSHDLDNNVLSEHCIRVDDVSSRELFINLWITNTLILIL